jgi:hypothetical protein
MRLKLFCRIVLALVCGAVATETASAQGYSFAECKRRLELSQLVPVVERPASSPRFHQFCIGMSPYTPIAVPGGFTCCAQTLGGLRGRGR